MDVTSEKELENIINEVVCSICLEFYTEPVMIDCGHNFCKKCILDYWEKQKDDITCPKCQEQFTQPNTRLNRFAASMVESVRKLTVKPKESEDIRCPQHDEKLKLFCESDKSPVCVVCAVSQEHKDHKISPLKDVTEVYMGKLQTALEFLNKQVDEISNCQVSQQTNIAELKKQANDMRKNIESEFAKLRQFLREEEKLVMGKIKQKEDGVLHQLEQNLKAVSVENALMNQRISEIQRRMTLQEVELLKMELRNRLDEFMYGWCNVRSAEMPYTRPTEVRIDLNLREPTGPLQYTVWRRMLEVITPVPASLTLDPQTAHPRLILSEDHTQVKRGEWRKVPDLPERFNFLLSVLASQGFTSGRHYWEVDVSSNTAWDVGAAKSSVTRKAIPQNGIWAVGLWDKEYSAFTNPRTSLSLDEGPKRLGIYLDYEEGQISFYNAVTMEHIYTFSDKFTEAIHPYFSTECKVSALKVVTVQI
ncbi:E3 ubiquitin-protein ligase TRIM39-like [Hypanus sabinus]|uniref:E3 ubiquitin-protein ligase TRIM39-like n=1 Tax=Hypanus sabinus TaxID=79690 RepID=UPI0028C4FE43|nr:E3 ubiquitin-protein ligase TRIM39-like [Hypanus sabinus]